MPIIIYVYITGGQNSSTLTAGPFFKPLSTYLMSKYIEHQNELKISKTFKNVSYERSLKTFISLG